MPFGCGQCLPCRLSRRRIWSHRIMLEAYKHAKNAFVTLTYNDENLPNEKTLVPSDFQKFLKRLRKSHAPQSLRFFGCGEYGEVSNRPHYHCALFGLGPEDAQSIDDSWGLGFTYTGDLTHDSAQYIAGYVTKKMTKKDDPRLNGRYPEFARMSLKPGIGAPAVADIADTLTSPAGCDALASVGDVPHHLILERKQIPLGRYIRGKLREKLHFPDKKTPQESLDLWKAEMQKLHEDFKSETAGKALSQYLDKKQHFKQWLIDKNAQKVLQLETKSKIYSAKKDKL